MKPLKIAIVTNNYKPYSGGVVSSIDSFRNAMQKLGHKVFIITLDFMGGYKQQGTDIIQLKCPIRFLYYGNKMAIPWRPSHYLCSVFEKIKPDIIHSQHPFLLGPAATKAARCLKIPIIFTYHTLYEKYVHYVPFPEALAAPLTKKLAQVYCNQMDGIIAPSKSIEEILKAAKVKKQIKIIPSPILPVFLKENLTIKNAISPFELITVSRFTKEKNLPFLLKIFSQLDQSKFNFKLVGYGPELNNLKQLTQELKLSPTKIKFIISPTKPNLAELYEKAHLFIFSSTTETQGLVLAEAMASGTPVIALEASGSRDIIKNNQNGFLVKTETAFLKRINQLEQESSLYKKLQVNAFKTGHQYSPQFLATKLIDFYKEFI